MVVLGELRARRCRFGRHRRIHLGHGEHELAAVDAPLCVDHLDHDVVGVRKVAVVDGHAEALQSLEIHVRQTDRDGLRRHALIGRDSTHPQPRGRRRTVDPSTVTRAAVPAQMDVRVRMAPPFRARLSRGSPLVLPPTDWMLCDMMTPYLQLVASGTDNAAANRRVIRRTADEKVVAAGVDLPSALAARRRRGQEIEHLGQQRLDVVPIVLARLPVGEGSASRTSSTAAVSPGSSQTLAKALSSLGGRARRGRRRRHVALHNLGAGAGTDICHGNGHRQRVTGLERRGRQRRLARSETTCSSGRGRTRSAARSRCARSPGSP